MCMRVIISMCACGYFKLSETVIKLFTVHLVHVDHEIEKYREDEQIHSLMGAAGWAAPAKNMK